LNTTRQVPTRRRKLDEPCSALTLFASAAGSVASKSIFDLIRGSTFFGIRVSALDALAGVDDRFCHRSAAPSNLLALGTPAIWPLSTGLRKFDARP
jgi:hypothetical protein